ncbi:MAG: trigger factor [Minwuiales bacterium]|nr:trigger factor [Minwuiales bacterium]
MQVVQNAAEGLKREFTITVPADEIATKVTEKLASLRQQVNMKGFRPGKVPVNLLKKMYGQAVMGEVLEETVNASSQQALQDGELRPATQPKIEVQKFEEGSELEYTMAVEVMPEFDPMDFGKLELERLTAEVEESRVDEAIANIAEQQKTFEPISGNRKSKKGDALLIDFAGKVDGEAFEGGTATDFQLELGSGRFIPGFEDQLIGAKAGEKSNVEVTFPEDYQAKELAGKAAVFEVEVKEVREAKAVEVNDDFAKQMGLDDLDALKNAVRGQLEQELSGMTRMRLKRSLLDALADNHDFEVPPGMVDSEFQQIVGQLRAQQGDAGHDEDHDNEKVDATEEEKSEYMPIAERRVRLGLLLAEVGQRNSIDVNADEVNRAIMEQARRFPGQERQVMEFYTKTPEAMAQIRAPLFEDKVVDYILEMAKLTDRPVSAEELARDPDDETESSEKKAKPARKTKAKGGKKASDKSAEADQSDAAT